VRQLIRIKGRSATKSSFVDIELFIVMLTSWLIIKLRITTNSKLKN
jgi:hypothetical protein